MKLSHLKSLFILGTLSFFASCGGDDTTEASLAEYYIQFTMNGQLYTFQVAEPGYQACGSCVCVSVPPFAPSTAELNVCIDNESEEFPASAIENLTESSIVFSEEDFPHASFNFTLNGAYYSTFYAADQPGSTFAITDVEADGEFGVTGGSTTFQMYKVKGTFACNVRADNGSADIAITNGKFVVRFSEN